MNNQDNYDNIKVKRQRRRLYEPLIQDVNTTKQDVQLINDQEPKEIYAKKIIKKYSSIAASTALLPLPVIDMLAVSGLQLKMLKELCEHYEKEFSKQRVKAIIVSLTGGVHAGLFAARLFKYVPFVGMAGAVVPLAAICGAMTYAIGILFVKHFDVGGDLFDFDTKTNKELFKKEYQKSLSQSQAV